MTNLPLLKDLYYKAVTRCEDGNACKLTIYHYELEDEPDALTVAYMSGYHDGKKSKENS